MCGIAGFVDRWTAGEARAGVGVGGDEVAVGWDQEDIVEGDAVGEDLGVFHGTVIVGGVGSVKSCGQWAVGSVGEARISKAE